MSATEAIRETDDVRTGFRAASSSSPTPATKPEIGVGALRAFGNTPPLARFSGDEAGAL